MPLLDQVRSEVAVLKAPPFSRTAHTFSHIFAGGYAACFENALLRVSRESGHRFADGDVEVVAEIGLSRNDSGSFVLSRRARCLQ